MHSVEHLIQSLLGGVFEVEDQRKDQLMVDIAKDDRGNALNLLRKCLPSISVHPFDVLPIYSCDSVVVNGFLYSIDNSIRRETEYKSDEDDGDIDDN